MAVNVQQEVSLVVEFIYIYIERERERKGEGENSRYFVRLSFLFVLNEKIDSTVGTDAQG